MCCNDEHDKNENPVKCVVVVAIIIWENSAIKSERDSFATYWGEVQNVFTC